MDKNVMKPRKTGVRAARRHRTPVPRDGTGCALTGLDENLHGVLSLRSRAR
jgi:hypothetical protein